MAEVKGGDKLAAAIEDLARNLESAAAVEIGFLEGATYPDGTPVALVAALNEFGSPSRGMPPRPFFRTMIEERSPEWPDAIAANLKANNYQAEKSLEQIGEAIAGQLRQSIASFVGAPLKPSTIKRKGSEKQLVDSGHMLNSIAAQVLKEDE